MKQRPRRIRVNLRDNTIRVETFNVLTNEWVENLVASFKPEVVKVEKPYNVPGIQISLLDDTQEGWQTVLRAAIL